MLEAIRKRTASIFVKGLLGLLVVSFAIWGIGDVFRGGGGTTAVAQVGNVEIRPDQFNTELQREMNRLRTVFGGELDLERARALGLADSVLGRMINDVLPCTVRGPRGDPGGVPPATVCGGSPRGPRARRRRFV